MAEEDHPPEQLRGSLPLQDPWKLLAKTPAAGVKDSAVTKSMTLLRPKTEEDYQDTKLDASQTVALVDDVLLKGNDLRHAPNCVMIPWTSKPKQKLARR